MQERLARGNALPPYAWYSLALGVTLVAFWPSFLAQLATTDAAHLVHGFTATAWMLVPAVQSWLIRHRRTTLHRRVGWASAVVLAPALVLSGLRMVQLMVLRYIDTHALRLLKFTFLDLAALALFVGFLVGAIVAIRRGKRQLHMQLLTVTVLFALEPAMERIWVFYVPGVDGFAEGLYYALATMELITLVLVYRTWRAGRTSMPYATALAFFVVMHLSLTSIAMSPGFERFSLWYAAL